MNKVRYDFCVGMRRVIGVVSFVLLISVSASAQMVGQFSYGNDGRLYLYLQNNTGYTLSFRSEVYSTLRKTGNSETCTVLPGHGLFLGPSTPWRWQWCENDVFTITYPTGYQQTWVCPVNDYKGTTFGKTTWEEKYGGKKCTEYVGRNGNYCNCSGFVSKHNDPAYCANCGHHAKKHTRTK